MPFLPEPPILQIRNLCKHYEPRRGFGGTRTTIKAVDSVSFELYRGETLGLVGESGCGKSSVARTILRLEQPTSGEVLFRSRDVARMAGAELKEFRRKVQVVFQDPYAALNPRMTVEEIVSEPWMIHRGFVPRVEWGDRVRDLLVRVGLRREHAERYAHQFSGGQLQRIAIARAMVLDPEVLICDEPVSALDLSVQAQVINLLEDIQARTGIAYLFIAHDLSVVRHLSDRVAVMYLGRMAEIGAGEEVFEAPVHPYTAALLSAEPTLDVTAPARPRIQLLGEIPSPANPPSGCRFRNRCWRAQAICAAEVPALSPQPRGSTRQAACHFPLDAVAREAALT